MTETIVPIILGVVASGGLWTFIQYLISRNDDKKKAMDDLIKAIAQLQTSVDENNKDMKLQNEALMAMAQDRILFLAREYLKQGWIYDKDLSNLRRMADAYKALDGNGDVHILMDLVDKLPIKIKGEH